MRTKNKNVLMFFGLGHDDLHRESLKSGRKVMGRVQASLPVSMLEFREIVDKYFLEWMNPDERLGYAVLVGLLGGRSFEELARSMGHGAAKCRESVGKFGNMFCLTATKDLFAWLPTEVAAALKCEEKGDEKAAVHVRCLPPISTNKTGNCTTWIPQRPLTNVSMEFADDILRLMSGHPGVIKLVRWARSYKLDRDEAVQEIMIAMWDALRSFDPKISSLETFMLHCAKKKLCTRISRDRMIRRRLRETPFDEYRVFPPPMRRAPDDKALEVRKGRVESMTAMEMLAIRERANGASYRQMADKSFSDTKSVDNALYRVCRKMTAKGSGSLFS